MRVRAALLLMLAMAGTASAQTLADETRALAQARARSTRAEADARAFEAAARAATDAARKARAERGAVTARIAAAADDIRAAEARAGIIAALRQSQRARLAGARRPLASLTAALQTMARRPPALALAQPGSLADAVHVRAVLGAALPEITRRTAALRVELARSERLTREAEVAAAALADGRRRLGERRAALARLEEAQARRGAALARSAETETDRALALGEQARDIVDRLEELGEERATADRLARLPGPVLRPPVPGRPSNPPEPARPYRLPVAGTLVTGFGELAESGVRAKGLTLATADGAMVAAPLPGRVVFAGPFRSYRRIVILDHGRGWTTLVTGLDALVVPAGLRVAAGEPVGRAPGERPRITIELRRASRAVDPAPLVGPDPVTTRRGGTDG